ncbi:hypothetical protein M407DRAFT_17338 [Tulasnella calospora MUT 4182]|uniref:Protein kinase domain-containing protein n=1 Tax=Tulasnella calospora MUT 4182 TaxID=1051891 RepID=A0A0C3LIA1_9AGAM|nr:hypothetical protein M407DRAFT_17338 [Tulasnella calospora MUT 4182]
MQEQQATPASGQKITSNHSFSQHTAPDIDYFLRAELRKSAVQEVNVDTFLAFANVQQFWDDPEWNQMFETLKTDTTQVDLRKSWFAVQQFEKEQYRPFCEWVERLVMLINGFKQPSSRAVKFLPLGSKLLTTTPGYADGSEVNGTSTKIKPDAVCVLEGEANEFGNWFQVLVPIEFKRKPPPEQESPRTGSTSSAHTPSTPKRSRTSAKETDSPAKRAENASSSHTPSTPRRPRTSVEENNPPAKKAKHSHIPLRVTSRALDTTPRPVYAPTCDDIQLARYTMETLAAVGDRTHAFGLAVNRPNVTLWYFDRCGAVRSHPLNVQDPHDDGFLSFVKFLSALVYMEDDALGFNPFFPTETGTKRVKMRKDLCEISVKISETGLASLKLQQQLDRRTGLVGRATLVYQADLWPQGEGNGVPVRAVLKLSWQHIGRKSEYDILKTLHMDPEASQHVVEVFDSMVGPTVSSQRGRFGEPNPEVVDDRALQYTVSEYLSPVTELSQPFHIPHIGWSVLQAINFLKGAGWFHRDISVGNIGFQLVPNCGGAIVKLLDFDLSKEIGSSSNAPHWTGTLPFMSIELLEVPKVVHKLGFEVEALMWTLLWIVRVYVDGKEEYDGNHPLIGWFLDYRTVENVAITKKDYLQRIKGFTNDWYKGLELQMRSLARTWHEMRDGQRKMRIKADDEHLVSDSMYGDEGFQEIENWMLDAGWNVPARRCTCGTHCARL